MIFSPKLVIKHKLYFLLKIISIFIMENKIQSLWETLLFYSVSFNNKIETEISYHYDFKE